MSEKYNVYVVGCNESLGRMVCAAIKDSQDMIITDGYDRNPGSNVNGGSISVSDSHFFLDNADVVIICSTSGIAMQAIAAAAEYDIPVVVDPCGLSDEQKYDLSIAATTIPIFQVHQIASLYTCIYARDLLTYAKYIMNQDKPGLYDITNYYSWN